jgi:hypothetical protein
LGRLFERTEDRDEQTIEKSVNAQAKAITDWGTTSDISISEINHPVLIIREAMMK